MIQAIVLISVDDFTDGRKVADNIMTQTFKTADAVRKVARKQEVGLDEEAEVGVYTLETFMEACNEQEINLENYWVSYVTLEKFY